MTEAYSRKEQLMRKAAEKKLAEALGLLKSLGVTFRKQTAKGSPVVDFLSEEAKVLIELDVNEEPDERQARYNETRAQLLEQRGYRFIRLWTHDVERNLAQTMARIMGVLREQHERLSATPKAEPPKNGAPPDSNGDLPPPRRTAARR